MNRHIGLEYPAFRGHRHEGDVGREDERSRAVPSSLIQQRDGVGSRRQRGSNPSEIERHSRGVASRQCKHRAFPLSRTDCPENFGRARALILGSIPCGHAVS